MEHTCSTLPLILPEQGLHKPSVPLPSLAVPTLPDHLWIITGGTPGGLQRAKCRSYLATAGHDIA